MIRTCSCGGRVIPLGPVGSREPMRHFKCDHCGRTYQQKARQAKKLVPDA